jgi:hypothetical protein
VRWNVVPPIVALALGAMSGGARGGDAGGDPAPGIEIAEGVPFSADELREAVRLRGSGEVTLVVRPGGPDGAVVVIVDDRARTVVLRGLQGAAAARKVALLVLDLLEGDGAGRPAAPAGASATDAVALSLPTPPLSGMTDAGPSRPGDAAAPEIPRWRLIAHTGAGTSEALRLALSLERAVAGPLRVVAGGGFAAAVAPAGVALRRIPLWLGIGAATRRAGLVLDVHAAALASIDQVAVEDDDATRSHRDLQWGGTADLGLARPVGAYAALGLRVGLDAHATSTEYRLGGEAVMVTPRLVPWLSLSLSMSLEAAP